MTDVSTTNDKATRSAVSKRDYIGQDGEVVKKMEEAYGARYSLLGTEHVFNLPVKGEHVDADTVAMFAVIGFHTKIGNVANTVLNDKNDPGDKDDAAAAIEAFLDDVARGVWAERTEGGGGAKVDRDALCDAIMQVMVPALEGKGKEPLDPVAVRQRLDDDKAFFRNMRQVPEIRKAYEEIVGKSSGKTVADVADLFA